MSPQNAHSNLMRIRRKLIQRAMQNLARGEGVRENFEEQLARFYNLLEQAFVTGDSAWLDAVIIDWVSASTQTDLVEDQKSATRLLNVLFTLTNEVARESLSKGEALDLIMAAQTNFIYALDKASRLEMENRVAYFTGEVASVRQKLEQLDRSKSSFISVAAHELKTPLTLIDGYTSMMCETSASLEVKKSMDPLLQGVKTGIQRLRQIVDDMLDVSLIDNNMLSLNTQPLWLSRILEMVQKNLGEVVRERQLKLEIIKFPGSEEWLYADPERLFQAFQNLLSNAIKYTPNGGFITVDGRTLPGFIEVTVTDTGIGISPENQAKIFEKFGQLGRTDLHTSSKVKFKGGGPGLGLSITRGIIEAHGGTIWVESEGYDERMCPGSRFHVLLPVHTESPNPRLTKLFGILTNPDEGPYDQKEDPANHPAS